MVLRTKSKLLNLASKAFTILVHTSICTHTSFPALSLFSYHSDPLCVLQKVLACSHLYEIYQAFSLPEITFLLTLHLVNAYSSLR